MKDAASILTDLQQFRLYKLREELRKAIEEKASEAFDFDSSLSGYDIRFIAKTILRFLLKFEAAHKNFPLTEESSSRFEELFFPNYDSTKSSQITAINILEYGQQAQLFFWNSEKCIGLIDLDLLVQTLKHSFPKSFALNKKRLAQEIQRNTLNLQTATTQQVNALEKQPLPKKLKFLTELGIQDKNNNQENEKFVLVKNFNAFRDMLATIYSSSNCSFILLTLFFIEGYLRNEIITNAMCYNLRLGITKATTWQKLTTLCSKGILSNSKIHKNTKELAENFLTSLKQGEVKITLFAKTNNLDIDLTSYIKGLLNVDEELIGLATKKGLAHYIIPDLKNLNVTAALQLLLNDKSVMQQTDQQNTANFLGTLDKTLQSKSAEQSITTIPSFETGDWDLNEIDEFEETVDFDIPKNS